jgi:hypothetical protein
LRGGGVLALKHVLDEDAALSDFLVEVKGSLLEEIKRTIVVGR